MDCNIRFHFDVARMTIANTFHISNKQCRAWARKKHIEKQRYTLIRNIHTNSNTVDQHVCGLSHLSMIEPAPRSSGRACRHWFFCRQCRNGPPLPPADHPTAPTTVWPLHRCPPAREHTAHHDKSITTRWRHAVCCWRSTWSAPE